MFARNWKFLVALVALVAIVGCTEPSTRPATLEVTGTVTYNGQPVDGARVTFSPTGDGDAASGTTDASGNFTLTSFEDGDGAVAGSYEVAVSKTEGGAAADTGAAGLTDSQEDMDALYEAAADEIAADQAGSAPKAEDLLPPKYKVASTSGFTANVAEGSDNNFTFELTD